VFRLREAPREISLTSTSSGAIDRAFPVVFGECMYVSLVALITEFVGI